MIETSKFKVEDAYEKPSPDLMLSEKQYENVAPEKHQASRLVDGLENQRFEGAHEGLSVTDH